MYLPLPPPFFPLDDSHTAACGRGKLQRIEGSSLPFFCHLGSPASLACLLAMSTRPFSNTAHSACSAACKYRAGRGGGGAVQEFGDWVLQMDQPTRACKVICVRICGLADRGQQFALALSRKPFFFGRPQSEQSNSGFAFFRFDNPVKNSNSVLFARWAGPSTQQKTRP